MNIIMFTTHHLHLHLITSFYFISFIIFHVRCYVFLMFFIVVIDPDHHNIKHCCLCITLGHASYINVTIIVGHANYIILLLINNSPLLRHNPTIHLPHNLLILTLTLNITTIDFNFYQPMP